MRRASASAVTAWACGGHFPGGQVTRTLELFSVEPVTAVDAPEDGNVHLLVLQHRGAPDRMVHLGDRL